MKYYIVEDGKLVVCTKRKVSVIPYIMIFAFAIACAVGGYSFAMHKFSIPAHKVVLEKIDYEHLKSIEEAFERSLDKPMGVQEYVLSRTQLAEVFKRVFPEVKLDDNTRDKYLDAVTVWSAHYSIPPLLVLSIIWRESFFDASTISSANARGPMQVIYFYHKEKLNSIGKGESDLHDIDTGVRIGVQILREYFNRYDRNIFRAMQAYVGGEHKTYARDILTRYFNARMHIEEQL